MDNLKTDEHVVSIIVCSRVNIGVEGGLGELKSAQWRMEKTGCNRVLGSCTEHHQIVFSLCDYFELLSKFFIKTSI